MRSRIQRLIADVTDRPTRLLFFIGCVCVSAAAPFLGGMIGAEGLSPLTGIDHIGSICLIALHFLLMPVRYVLQLLFVVGVGYAIWDRVGAVRSMRRTLRALSVQFVAKEGPFGAAAILAEVDPSVIRVVEGLPVPAFAVGLWSPRIYLDRRLVEDLSAEELAAVLRHEHAHVRRRDPLRLSMLRFIACTLFWVPILKRFVADMADEVELVADRIAAKSNPLTLASALITLAQRNVRPVGSFGGVTVGFNNNDILTRRVLALAGEQCRVKNRIPMRSMVGVLSIVSVTWIAGIVMAHPLPESTRHMQSGFSENLRCVRAWVTRSPHLCPHQQQHAKHLSS